MGSHSDGEYCDSCNSRVRVEKSWREELLERFTETLQELHENERFWDVKIIVEGKEYKCHRLILSAHSEYFKTMFSSEFQESKERKVQLEHPVTRRCFDKIISYMYKGEQIIDEDNAISILKLADYLQIHHLVKESAALLECSISRKNCFKCLKIARECNLDELRDACMYFMIKQFKPLIENYRDKFFQLDKEDFIEIIKDDNLNTVSERSVCNLAVHWLQYSFESRKGCFEDVLKVLKFPLVNAEYLINFMQIFPELTTLPYVQKYVNEGLRHQLVPAKRSCTDTFRSLHRVNQDMIDLLMIIGGEGRAGEFNYKYINNNWYCGPVDGLLRDDPNCFEWKYVVNLQKILTTPGILTTVYGNSDLYVIGSMPNDAATKGNAFLYNGQTGRIGKVGGPPPTHRIEYSLTECTGSFIYVIGGIDYQENPVETVSRYNTKQDSWENVGCLIEPVSKLEALSAIIDTRIYIFQKRLFYGIEVSYFQVYDTKNETCYKHRLFDFDPDYRLGYPEAICSQNDAIYLFSGWDKTVKTVSIVKFTDSHGMRFERVGEEFRTNTLLTNCQMLPIDDSLYIFGGKEEENGYDSEAESEDGYVRTVLKDEIFRFSLTDKKFYEVDVKLPEPQCSFMIQKITIRKDVLRKSSFGKVAGAPIHGFLLFLTPVQPQQFIQATSCSEVYEKGPPEKSLKPFPDNKILDYSNLKDIADDKLKCV